MKPVILAIAFLFFVQITNAQDSTQPAATPVDTTVTVVVAPARTAKVYDTARHLADSATLFSDLDFQMRHPEVLYQHTTKRFMPVFLIASIVLLALCLWLLFKTGLCKDLSYDPQTNLLRPAKVRPFSYARVQLFWWTVIILCCFTTFFFYTGLLVAFNSTVVLLLGGGLAVSIFGSVIDNSQIQENGTSVPIRHQDLDPTKGFFIDILSDEGGISIHRFQAVMFNIIFGIAFIHSFCALTMAKLYPFLEFEPWQLTLLGISAAGYLGFKANENSTATKTQRQIHAVTKTNSDNEAVNDTTAAGATENPVQPAFKTMAYQNLKANVLQNTISNDPKE